MGARTGVSRAMGPSREHGQADRKAKAIARRLECQCDAPPISQTIGGFSMEVRESVVEKDG